MVTITIVLKQEDGREGEVNIHAKSLEAYRDRKKDALDTIDRIIEGLLLPNENKKHG